MQLTGHHKVKPAQFWAGQELAPVQMLVKAPQKLDLKLVKVKGELVHETFLGELGGLLRLDLNQRGAANERARYVAHLSVEVVPHGVERLPLVRVVEKGAHFGVLHGNPFK